MQFASSLLRIYITINFILGYITPRIKKLLRRHNKLRRAGKTEQANHIALTINQQIVHSRSIALAGASNTDTRQLWSLLKRTGNWGANKQTISNILT